MWPLPAIPLKVLAGAVAVLAVLASLWAWGNHRAGQGRAEVQAQWDLAKAQQQEALRLAEQRERALERSGQSIVNQEVQRARQEDPHAAAAAADLRSARDRVQQLAEELAAATAAAGPVASAAIGSTPVAGAGLVLADLYRGADAEAAELAAAFDEARRRGLRCERISDALSAEFNAASAPE